jgi:hypothetical protein
MHTGTILRTAGDLLQLGSYPSWSPYQDERIERSITFHQGNVFRDNSYVGRWRFMARDQSRVLGFRAWRSAPYRQDRGSTLRGPR